MGERRGPARDARLGAHPLTGLQRVLEEGGEHRAADPILFCLLEGPTDLPDHFALAQDGRLEPGRDGEEMGRHVVVEADRGMRRQLLDGDAGLVGQDFVHLGHRIVEAIHDGVDLRPQARREHHHLLQIATVTEVRQHLVQVRVTERHRLEEREGGLLVLEPYDDDGHADASWGRPSSMPVTRVRCQSPRSGQVRPGQ
jgi:hypothetical protein